MDKLSNQEYVFTHLTEFNSSVVIDYYLDDDKFTEEYILTNIEYFNPYIEKIVKFKKHLSDNFFEKICTKDNYSHFKCLRRLKEPIRDFKMLDNKFY